MHRKEFYKHILYLLLLLIIFNGCGSDNETTELDKNHQKHFSYDSANRVTKEDLGNGNYIKYTYDNSGNLIKQEVVK